MIQLFLWAGHVFFNEQECVNRDRREVRLAFGSHDEKFAVVLSPVEAGEIGQGLTEAAGYALIDEVPAGATFEGDE